VLADSEGQPDVILMATGSEVQLCVSAYEQLKAEGIKARVVSMPSWEIFEHQDEAYRESVIPTIVRARVAVEQAAKFGWQRYTTNNDQIIGMKTFGASAPLKELTKKFGFTIENVVATAKREIQKAGL
jgi:transketolase